jgi:hypothetical protein
VTVGVTPREEIRASPALAAAVPASPQGNVWFGGIAASTLVAATAVGLWLAFGVGMRDLLLFAAYQAGFVALPGWLLYRALAPRDSLGRTVVFGWSLGYALEVSAFLAASAVGARGLFAFYPLLSAPLAVAVLRQRRERDRPRPNGDRRAVWAAAATGIVTLLYLAVTYFTKTPLPWDIEKVTYNTDIPYHLTLAGEALHHWPMTDPNISGTGLYYHVWAHLDLAATSSVTGLPLPLLLFRFALVPLTLLFLGQLLIAGRAFTGRAWTGAVAGALLLLVGEVDLEPWLSYPFLGLFFTDVWLSPTFLLGLVFFVPAITLLAERLTTGESLRAGWRQWLLLCMFLIACSGAKATILPVVLGALAITIALRWWTTRRVEANALAAVGAAALSLLVFYLLIYRHSSLGLGLEPFGSYANMAWVTDLRHAIGDGIGWPLGVTLATLGLFGPQLAGLGAFFLLRRRLDTRRLFLLALFVVGLGPFVLMHQSGNSQVFFAEYGLVGATLLAAEGIVLLATAWAPREVMRASGVAILATAACVVLVVYGIATNIDIGSRSLVVFVALEAVFLLLWRYGSPSGRRMPLVAAAVTSATGLFVVLWRFGVNTNLADAGYELVAALLLLGLGALLVLRGERRRELGLLLVIGFATVGALDLPLDQGPDAVNRIQNDQPFFNAGETGLNNGLYDGLAWIRDHTSADAVLAVNNYEERNGGFVLPVYVYYSAFAERRVFLEGWLFSAASWNIVGQDALTSRKVPFPERLRLNRAVFERADAQALRVLVRNYGVRYLVDDRLQGKASPALGRLGRMAYMNPSVIVYAVGPAQRHA